MKEKILTIINDIRLSKDLPVLEDEFDIDIFEDGLVSTVGEIYTKLDKE